jgi:DNA-binding MarR family transcriptional regulator
MCKGKSEQPLFEGCCTAETPGEEPSADATRRAGKSLVYKLLEVRRSMTAEEQAFLPQINECLASVRSYSSLSDTQREELVLHAIEKSMATNIKEISEDTRLDPAIVKAIVQDLGSRGILYQVKRYIPGSDRQYFLIKSRRVKNVEAHGVMFGPECPGTQLASAVP